MNNIEYRSINFEEKLTKISEHWSPKVVARLNDYYLKIAKVQGEFVWHDHAETDEVFIVLSGHLDILFRDGKVSLNAGEMVVVPKGVEHKPVAEEECHILLIEPAGTANTGNVDDALTAPNDAWI
jgi:mannose-6-phosphate isomerase-like protein (cupin superfamily)